MPDVSGIGNPGSAIDFLAAICPSVAEERERLHAVLKLTGGERLAKLANLRALVAVLKARLARVTAARSPYKGGRRRNMRRPTFQARRKHLMERLGLVIDDVERELGVACMADILANCDYPKGKEVQVERPD